MMVVMLLGAFRPLEAHDYSCLPAAGRKWAVLVIEDHPGMREAVWDPSFTSPTMEGAFRPDHRYALRTTGTPALVDLGCWDDAFHYGGDQCGDQAGHSDRCDDHTGGSVVTVTWTGDRKGVILKVGGKSTWLPMLGAWDASCAPTGTFRGAYLNWLLQNRPTTPSIPKETRWQRLQRGANALATQLLNRSGGAPEYRIEGVSASGRLLIPPGEGLPAALNAVSRMEPAAKGYAIKDALNGVVDMVRELKNRGGCQPGLVIVVSDGWGLASSCATGSAYENQAQYSVLQQQAAAIAATAQAAVWAWDVDGPSLWNGTLASKGMGISFDADAVAALQASAKAWMQGAGQPPQVKLSLDQPALTRLSQVTLTITVDRPLSSATLNGQALTLTALTTQLPQVLKEGLNTFLVKVQTPCGTNQASLSVTLDSVAPKVQLDQAPPALTNLTSLRISGRVDDPTSVLTLNGTGLALDVQGRFVATASLPLEGDNLLTFRAVDAAGNEGRLEVHVQRDTVAPVVTLSSPDEGLVTRAEHVDVVGHVDDSHAQVQVNGQVVVVKPDGLFTLPLNLPEGPMEIRVTAADLAGNQGTATRRITVDRTAPKITLDQPLPSLVALVQIHVSGSVDDLSATFKLNETVVPLDAQGRFSLDIPLVEGANPLSFRAADAAGNEGALEGAVTRDMTPPVLVLATPAEGQHVNTPQVQLVGQVDDPSAIITVNGDVVPQVGGTFTATAAPAEGPFTFTVVAMDPAGNRAVAQRSILVDRAGPVITLTRPVPPLVALLTLPLQGTVSVPSASLTLNGVAVPLDPSGAFSVTATLVEGPNTFHFVATDGFGKSGSLDAATVRDTVAPVITLDSPNNGLVTNQGVLLVQGRVDDVTARFTLNGSVVSLDAQGRFSASWTLPLSGINTLSLQATDAAGNSGTLSISVLRDAVPPKITLTTPTEGWLTRAATIQVEGQVDKPNVQISVNGVGAQLDANGHFIATLTPSEGTYPIQATAVDLAGNSASATRTIVVDRTAPVITLSQGVPPLTNAKSLTLTGTVDDPKATLTLNGQTVAVDPVGAFTATAPLPTEGTNTLSFEATDLVGNVGNLTLTTVRDTTPPVVKILTPQDGFATNEHAVVVKGTLDDASATFTIQGKSVSVASDGTWETTLSVSKEGALSIKAEATDQAGNVGKAATYAFFDWTPPTLTWVNPTPAEKTILASPVVNAAVTISEPALASLNGVTAPLEPSDVAGAPFVVRGEVTLQEGHAVLEVEAVDRAGNKASIFRLLDVGLTKPTLQVTAPTFQADGTYSTSNPGVQITGLVTAPEGLKPLTLTLNGASVPLDASGRFSLPMDLVQGRNPVHFVASTSVGQSVTQDFTVIRTAGGPGDPNDPTAPGIQILWPLEGFATGSASMSVRGRVSQPGLQVTVNGMPASVDSLALTFTQNVTLVPGPNSIQAVATAADSRSASTQVRGSYVQPGTATYQWDLPANGARVKTREITLSGKADQPGILGVTVNGIPMSLSAGPAGQATFTGSLILPAKGRNALLMEVRTLAGDTRTERRDVVFEPELPRILLSAPDAARPGQDITLSVQPDGTTQLQAVDLSWNGRLLGRLTPPFAAIQATVPADAVVGTKLSVEAVATDIQGEVVTARTFVTVYGQGALLAEAFDDRTGLLLKEGVATVEGGESRPLDSTGRATLATALPTSWVLVEKAGMTPVWRSAGLKVGGVEAIADARLTPLDPAQAAGPGAFTGGFGKALTLTLPAGTLAQGTQVSCTPLSTHGLPALLPAGWSVVSAWWLDAQGASFQAPGATAALSAESLAILPVDVRLAWVRWDATSHQWTVQAPSLHVADCSTLAMPLPGGYALVAADPGATAPPEAVLGSSLPAYLGATWRDGLKAAGSVSPSILPTVEAIHGVRATAEFRLTFDGGDPIPSGLVLQTDTLESYTLVDDRLIEPDSSTQDAVASRWMLEVIDGQPRVTGAGEGLAMRLPLRMSRTFGDSELVEGRIVVGFYHDGIQVAQGGSTLMGPQGGTLNQDGLTLTFDQGAFSGSTLVRLSVVPGDPAALWADVVGQGAIVKSFQVDIVGQLFKGMRLKMAGLGSPAQMPILVQRRVVQGQRLVVAVGGLQPVAGSLGDWELAIPAEGNPLMEGGSFAILVPTQTWAWVTGTAFMDPGLAQGLKARASAAKSLRLAPMVAGEPTPVGDAVVQAGYLPAVSGLEGHFAVPVFTTPATNTLQGQRWDLGVSGSLDAAVPSSGNLLQLASVPFQVVTALPAEGAQVAPGSVLTLLLSGPADPMTTSNVKLYRVVPVAQIAPSSLKVAGKKGTAPSAAVKSKAKPKVPAKASTKGSKTALLLQEPTPTELVEVLLRRNLSQDGKTLLLTPDQPLALGTSYVLVVDGLQSLGGQTAPQLVRNFKTTAQPVSAVVDFRRFKLSYPDAQLNVTVTVPAGAVPARATVQVEAPEMGAVGAGVMPDGQALVFPMKAALGQRLTARVQLYSGEVIEGFLSRYESTDGSGRVTLGIDGGRVESVDGSGAAMTLPEGSLDRPAELKVQFTQETSPVLKGEAAQVPIWGRVQLLADRSLGLKKIPVIEMAAPADAINLSQDNPRIGTYAVAYRTDGFDVDGSPASSYMVCDTADVENGKFKSKGGFPSLPVTLDDDVQLPTIQVKGNQPGLMAKVRPIQAAAASTGPICSAQEGLFPAPTVMQWGVYGYSLSALMIYPVVSSSRGFDVELDGMIVKNPGKVILQGKAVRRLPGDAYSTPAIMASLFYSAAGDGDVRSNGRFMQYTNECGSYMLMNAYFFDEVLKETGTVLGVERDYGSTASVPIPAKAAAVDTAKDRKYFEMDTLRFYIQPQELGDLTPPWARMDLRQNGQPVEPDNVKAGELEVQIRARDNKKGAALRVELRLDQLQPILCGANGTGVSSSSYDYTPAGDMGLWRIRIQVPAGAHTLECFISDEGASGPSPQPMGNTTKLSKQISVLDFASGNRPVDPANPPSFTVQVEGGLQAARPDTSVRIDFNEPVKNVSLSTLTLEKSVSGAWQAVADCRLRSGLVGVDQTTIAYLIPPSRLELGSTYRVSGSNSIVDLDSPPKALAQGPISFVVQQYQSLGSVSVGSAGQVSAVGNTAFVITGQTPNVAVSMLQLNSESLDLVAQAGLTGPGSGFMNQGINTIRAFENVTTQNFPGPGLLLVTTTPQPDRYQDSSCLWGFRFCGARGEIELVFGVSLGRGTVGYAPTVDYRDGVIAVGRLTSSVQLISLDNAIAKWNGDVAGTITPVGNNQGAVFQPFWLSDPDYHFENQYTFGSLHYGVAIVPTATQGQDFIRVAVANNNYESQWRGTSIAGLPQMWIPYTAGALSTPVPPFIADAGSVPFSEVMFAPAAHAFLQLGPNIGNSTQHVLAWPNASIEVGGQRYTTTLMVSISRKIAPAGGNSLLLSDANDPSKYWIWPNVSPLPNSGSYEIQYRKVCLDPATGLAAILVRPQSGGDGYWVLLDINRPDDPQIVGRIPAPAGYSSASLSYGAMYLGKSDNSFEVINILRPTSSGSFASLSQSRSPGSRESTTRQTLNSAKSNKANKFASQTTVGFAVRQSGVVPVVEQEKPTCESPAEDKCKDDPRDLASVRDAIVTGGFDVNSYAIAFTAYLEAESSELGLNSKKAIIDIIYNRVNASKVITPERKSPETTRRSIRQPILGLDNAFGDSPLEIVTSIRSDGKSHEFNPYDDQSRLAAVKGSLASTVDYIIRKNPGDEIAKHELCMYLECLQYAKGRLQGQPALVFSDPFVFYFTATYLRTKPGFMDKRLGVPRHMFSDFARQHVYEAIPSKSLNVLGHHFWGVSFAYYWTDPVHGAKNWILNYRDIAKNKETYMLGNCTVDPNHPSSVNGIRFYINATPGNSINADIIGTGRTATFGANLLNPKAQKGLTSFKAGKNLIFIEVETTLKNADGSNRKITSATDKPRSVNVVKIIK